MLIKAKRIDKLETKVNEYKNKLVVKYLNLKGYNCDASRVSILKAYSQLKKDNLKVIINTENERFARLGSYYIWEAYVKVSIVDIITGKEV